MNEFLKKSIFFLIFPSLYFGLIMAINTFFYSSQKVEIEKKNILIIGDSHPEKSLNPNYFSSALNIAQPAEPYVVTFWKLKKIFEFYVPDTLILGFSPHNISAFNDLKFFDKKWSGEMFKRTYPISHFNHIEGLVDIDHRTKYQVLWKQTAFYPKKNHINYIGSYSNKDLSDISDWQDAIKRHYYYQDSLVGSSECAINYLDSITTICLEKNITLVLASNPVHKNYLDNIPVQILEEFETIAKHYQAEQFVFNRLEEIYPDSLFLNSDHLNEKGTERFTLDLIELLKNKSNQ